MQVQANRLYDRLDKARHHSKYRPSARLSPGTSKDWWQYAIQCHLDHIHSRNLNSNWDAVIKRSIDLVDYANTYTKHLINPNSLDASDKDFIADMEAELGFSELKSLREVGMRRVEDLTPKQTPTHSGTVPTSPSMPPPCSASSSSLSSPSVSYPVSPAKSSSSQSQSSTSGETLLQRWFPSWAGWQSPPEAPVENAPSSFEDSLADEDKTLMELTSPSEEESLSLYETPLANTCNSPPTSLFDTQQEGFSQSLSCDDSLSSRVRRRKQLVSLEEEFLYVLSDSIENNTFTKRDAVFCQLSFTLKQGLFTLSSETSRQSSTMKLTELFQLDFSDVKMGLELKPRNKSYKFDIELGSLLLKDQVTKDSSFPYLVSPQSQSDSDSYNHYRASRKSSNHSAPGLHSNVFYSRSSSASSRSSTASDACPVSAAGSESRCIVSKPLFTLSYENCPANNTADHRLSVVTQPLDLVYNPDAMDSATNFFLLPLKTVSKYKHVFHSIPSTNLSVAARKRYDSIMEQTKKELRKNLDQIFQGGMRKQWAINLDISAPQIIIPEHFRDRNATLVVVDFGRLSFCSANAQNGSSKGIARTDRERTPVEPTKPKASSWGGFMAKMWGNATEDDEPDDQFTTPCSTPDELSDESESCQARPLTEELLHSHMYDKYDLQLCDMQVLVGKVRDNWRFAYHKGTSPMHVIDRFSINVLVSRRIVSVVPDDRPWPTATVSATLPSIMLHLNQTKVHVLVTLANTISERSHHKLDPDELHPSATGSFGEFSQFRGSDATDKSLPRSETASTLVSFSRDTFPDDGVPILKADPLSAFDNVSPKPGSSHYGQEPGDATKSIATIHDDTKLFVMQLKVEKVSIELVSRGRSIAEVQITGVKLIVQHRPHNYSASLTIHSLLLVDALQTFGPDFELLVASHKHISMDSVSGSLRDSEPCSPISPGSPDPNVSVSQSTRRPTSPVMLTKALHALATSPTPLNMKHSLSQKSINSFSKRSASSPPLISSPPGGIDVVDLDSEALISVEVTYVSDECPSQEGSGSLLMGSLQFNTIDIIANQETVVELVGFIHQLMSSPTCSKPSVVTESISPSDPVRRRNNFSQSRPATLDEGTASKLGNQSVYGSLAMLYHPSALENSFMASDTKKHPKKEPLRVEMGFDFTKLSVLLLRAAVKDRELVGRKVATAVMSQANIQTTLANHQLSVEGSLGGFQVRDITPETNKHQFIISVGQDVNADKHQDIITRLTTGLYQSYAERESESSSLKAFSFLVRRPLAFTNSSEWELNSSSHNAEDDGSLTVDLQLASVVYTHSPSFLHEVSSCADEFKQYMARLAQGIKHAATEMAMGLVSKRIESFAVLPGYGVTSGGASGFDSPSQRRNSLARSIDTIHLPHPPPATASHLSPTHAPPSDLSFRLKLSVVLETPIIVFPESNMSSSVMVAQLGQISIKNAEAPRPLILIDHAATGEYKQTINQTGETCGTVFVPKNCLEDEYQDDSVSRIVKYRIGVRDMSLYSLDIDERKTRRAALSLAPSLRTAADLYGCGSDCSAIVHSTSVQLYFIHKRLPSLLPDSHAGMFLFPTDVHNVIMEEEYFAASQPVDSVEVTGGVVSAVKLNVSRRQYRQLVQTIENFRITKKSDLSTAQHRHHHSLDSILEEGILSGSDKKQRRSSCTSEISCTASDGINLPEAALPGDPVSKDAKQHIIVRGEFTVDRVEVELVGDVNGSSQPLVNLILDEFKAHYENSNRYECTTKVTLKSLVMEDLQCPESSPHRFLLRSVEPPSPLQPAPRSDQAASPGFAPPPFISTSCPDIKNYIERADFLSRSLPARLEVEKPYFKAQQRPTVRSSVRRKRTQFRQNTAGSSMSLADVISEQIILIGTGDQDSKRKCPCTPPPSPIPDQSYLPSPENTPNLVRINVLIVDRQHSDFQTTYDGTDRFVDIAFNSLVTVVNIPSWVMILDFFGAKQERESNFTSQSREASAAFLLGLSDNFDQESSLNQTDGAGDLGEEQADADELNTVVDMSVVWLELVLVRVDGVGNAGAEVAGASISDVSVRSVGSAGDLTLTGHLGALSLTDRTPHGHRYQHKFVTSGTEALTFLVFKYGHPDPNMMRECDWRMNIKMSSVMYIHTQRFATELMHFIQQFNQLQNIVEKWRAIRAGQTVHDNARGARMSLSVSAGSPVIFLPLCGEGSDQVLVADLGSLGISNKFLWAGAAGTISKVEREALHDRLSCGRPSSRSRSRPNRSRSRSLGRSRSRHNANENMSSTGKPPKCLLDVLNIQLTKMDLYAAKLVDTEFKTMKKHFQNKTRSDIRSSSDTTTLEPNCSSDTASQGGIDTEEIVWEFPGFFVRREGCPLLREKCALTLQVERNLDPHVSQRVPDVSVQGCVSKVHATINEESYKLIRGLLQYNLGEDLTELHFQQKQLHHPHLPSHANIRQHEVGEDSHITLYIALDLDNVSVETLHAANASSDDAFDAETVKGSKPVPLAHVNLIKSRLMYQSNSDGGQDVDLVSQEILVNDTRFKDCPVNKRSNVFTNILQPTPHNTVKNQSLLQAELHFRSTKLVTRFTILLNNMRLMGIIDWWGEVLNFIQLSCPSPYLLSNLNSSTNNVPVSREASGLAMPHRPGSYRMHSSNSTPPFGLMTPNMEESPRSTSPMGVFGSTGNISRISSSIGRLTPRLHPLVESTGVMTKHLLIEDFDDTDASASTAELQQPPFELKINITDSEIVVVEDASLWNSSALIFKVRLH